MTSTVEIRLPIKTLARKGACNRASARQLDMSKGSVGHHRRRMAAEAVDGRSRHHHEAVGWAAAFDHRLTSRSASSAVNLADLYGWPAAELDFTGSLRGLQCDVAAH